MHVGHYTRDRFDRVSHNETSKHTDYCRRVSLRTANDVVRPQDTRRFVGPDRSSRFSRLTGFCSEWTEMDRVRDAYAADCFPVFTSSPLHQKAITRGRTDRFDMVFCRSVWTTNCWLAVKFLITISGLLSRCCALNGFAKKLLSLKRTHSTSHRPFEHTELDNQLVVSCFKW